MKKEKKPLTQMFTKEHYLECSGKNPTKFLLAELIEDDPKIRRMKMKKFVRDFNRKNRKGKGK